MKLSYLLNAAFQVESGCDCCEVNGELVPDKYNWTVNGKTYGKQALRKFL